MRKIFVNNYKQKGNLLAEMLVGLSLSLLTLLAVAVISIYFEKQSLQNRSLDKALNNTTTAFYELKMEGRNAGFGININSNAFGCNLNIYNVPNSSSPNVIKLYPAVIDTSGAVNHKLSFNAGDSYAVTIPTNLTSTANPGSVEDFYNVNSVFGYNVNDFVFGAPSSNVGNCYLNNVSSKDEQANKIYHRVLVGSGKPPYNDFKTSATLSSSVSIFNLGSNPRFTTFYVDGLNNLIKKNNITGEISLVLSNVVSFKAIYGITDTSGKLNWVSPSSMKDSDFKWLRAIRVGLIIKTDTPDSENNSICSTSSEGTLKKDYSLGANEILKIPTSNDSACFRYRFLTTTIPLKNMVHNKLN